VPFPRASVIVPVYNTARWLPASLASIDQQACRSELEVVIVDDGSTDESASIAREYATEAPDVRYVRQDHAGLGAARNHGIRLATGRYLGFLDSDDVYPPAGLDRLLFLADEHRAAIAVGDMQGLPPRPSPPWRRELATGQRIIGTIEEAPDLVGNPSACNKVFRREFVTVAGGRFSEGTGFEDVLFTVPLLLRAPRTVLSPHLAYLYRTRPDQSSIMDARGRPARILEHLAVVERLYAGVHSAPAASRAVVQRWICYMQMHYAWRAAAALDDDQLEDFTRRMSALFKDIPVDAVSEFIPNLDAGLRAAGIYEQDVRAVRAPRFGGPLLVRAGRLYAGHPHFDRYRELLRIDTAATAVTGLRGGSALTVTGSCLLPAITAESGQVRTDLLLEVGDLLIRRPLVVRRAGGNRLDWRCDLPAGLLEPGRHRLRVVVRDGGREMTPPLAASAGTRPVKVGGGRTAWLAAAAQPLLVVSAAPAAAALQDARWLAGAVWSRGRSAAGRRGRLAGRRGRLAVRRVGGHGRAAARAAARRGRTAVRRVRLGATRRRLLRR